MPGRRLRETGGRAATADRRVLVLGFGKEVLHVEMLTAGIRAARLPNIFHTAGP